MPYRVFTAKDPIGFKGEDTNLFGYTLNDPVNAIDQLGLWTISMGADVSAALGFGGGGGTFLNIGHSERDGWSFSITGTAQGGAIAGAGAFTGAAMTWTNASNVNQLTGTAYQAGRSGLFNLAVEGIKGSNYKGFTLMGGEGVGYTANSLTVSTTSALIQYQNSTLSLGAYGKNSIWSKTFGKTSISPKCK